MEQPRNLWDDKTSDRYSDDIGHALSYGVSILGRTGARMGWCRDIFTFYPAPRFEPAMVQALSHGKYTPFRIFQTLVNILMLVSMLALMYSSIVMSRYVFSFLSISGEMSIARRLHILGSYWGFLLMALHLGLHWNVLINFVLKRFPAKQPSVIYSLMFFLLGLVVSSFGLVALIKRDFPTYLLLKNEFVFWDYSESILRFYFDYVALMGLCIFVSHYLSKLFRKIGRQKSGSK